MNLTRVRRPASVASGPFRPALDSHLEKQMDFETFFRTDPLPNPTRPSITGVVCGVRVDEIGAPLMQEIRYLDKLINEPAKRKAMTKVIREG
ncbi:MAG: DUF2200 domain-containing protein [Ilumatobacteraceae bacterium]|nr:DUF2200 domain-containing protein [Ilumatobacteraceae bacterium]